MARFYFHVSSVHELIPDDEGLEFPTLSACHAHALTIVRECYPFVRKDPDRWWIEIANAAGRTVLVVLYPRHLEFGCRTGDPDRDAGYWARFLIRVCQEHAL
jgi:hypothetical protein